MIRILYTLLIDWLSTLRGIVERHPAVFSVSAWSPPYIGDTLGGRGVER
jgi:hypothetical protein